MRPNNPPKKASELQIHLEISVSVSGKVGRELLLMAIAAPVVLTVSLPVAFFFLLCGPFYLIAAILGLVDDGTR